MKGDLDMTVPEDELHKKGRPLIDWVKPVEWLLPNAEVYEEWEKDEEHEDVDFIDLYESGDEGIKNKAMSGREWIGILILSMSTDVSYIYTNSTYTGTSRAQHSQPFPPL